MTYEAKVRPTTRGGGLLGLAVAGVTLLASCQPALPSASPPSDVRTRASTPGWTATPQASAPTRTPGPAARTRVTVTYVSDGDTIVGRAQGVQVRVRLLGVDAPELAHDGVPAACGAGAARAALRQLVGGRTVTLVRDAHADRRDRFGRELGYVELGGADAAATLLRAGLVEAWYPASEPTPERDRAYRRLERDARAARRGSWATCATLGR